MIFVVAFLFFFISFQIIFFFFSLLLLFYFLSSFVFHFSFLQFCPVECLEMTLWGWKTTLKTSVCLVCISRAPEYALTYYLTVVFTLKILWKRTLISERVSERVSEWMSVWCSGNIIEWLFNTVCLLFQISFIQFQYASWPSYNGWRCWFEGGWKWNEMFRKHLCIWIFNMGTNRIAFIKIKLGNSRNVKMNWIENCKKKHFTMWLHWINEWSIRFHKRGMTVNNVNPVSYKSGIVFDYYWYRVLRYWRRYAICLHVSLLLLFYIQQNVECWTNPSIQLVWHWANSFDCVRNRQRTNITEPARERQPTMIL